MYVLPPSCKSACSGSFSRFQHLQAMESWRGLSTGVSVWSSSLPEFYWASRADHLDYPGSLIQVALWLMQKFRTCSIVNISRNPLSLWFISLVIFPMSAVLQHIASRETRRALSRARASEVKYSLISQVSSDYSFSTELNSQGNMRLNWVTGAFEKITGYTFEEYIANGGWLGASCTRTM